MPYTTSGTTTALTFSSADAVPWFAGDWATALQPPTVLIAGYDGDVRDVVAVELETAGYEILEAEDARTAMSLAVHERPQLILLDVSMPGLDGIGFCYELHSSPQTAHIPVIIISGSGDPAEVALGHVVGAEDYLAKGFSLAELLIRVQKLVPADRP